MLPLTFGILIFGKLGILTFGSLSFDLSCGFFFGGFFQSILEISTHGEGLHIISSGLSRW